MYNEKLIDLEKEDYIDYLVCVLGRKPEDAVWYADMVYQED